MYGRFKEEEICIEENAKLAEYPKIEDEKYKDYALVLGDLHGNAIKLIRHLIKHNRLIIDEETYHRLCQLHTIIACYNTLSLYKHYRRLLSRREKKLAEKGKDTSTLNNLRKYVEKLRQNYEPSKKYYKETVNKKIRTCNRNHATAALTEFQSILAKVKICSNAPVLLLGDDVAERDYAGDELMIWVYKALAVKGIKYHITHSNHGLKFIDYLESKKPLADFAYPSKIYDLNSRFVTQHQSFQHLALLIHKKILDGQEMLEDINLVWAQNLTLLNYHIEGNTITTLTHAFAGLRTLNNTFIEAGVNCDFMLANFPFAVDKANAKFAELYAAGNITPNAVTESIDDKNICFTNYLVALAWNRREPGVEGDVYSHEFNEIYWRFVHGHHNYGKHELKFVNDNCLSLNDKFAKEWPDSKGRKSISLRLSSGAHANFFGPGSKREAIPSSKSDQIRYNKPH